MATVTSPDYRSIRMRLGKYQLLRKLPTGGMAELFLAKTDGPMGSEKLLVIKRRSAGR